MTTTNVFCGFSGEKNSSKVLKPPGGGHTDIFGAPEPPVRRNMGRNASSILEGTNSDPTVHSPGKTSAPPQKASAPSQMTSASSQKSSAPPQKSTPADEPKTTASSNRTKIPPGGFSSGPLW